MRRWALLAGLVAGCAGGGSNGGTATDTDTDASTSTSFGPSTSDEESSTSGDPSESAEENSTTLESQSGEGSSGSGSSGSTGCPVGTLGCPCDAGDPPCEEGLECAEDVCAEPICPDKEFEDNDAFNDATELGEYDDGDPAQMFSSSLSGTQDIDWFTYTCNDTLLEDLVPTLAMDTAMPMHVCFYIDCLIGGNPLFECPAGTTPEQAPIGFIPGCCVDDASSINLSDYNCPDSDNDGVIVYIEAEMAASDTCIDYTMTYTC